MILNDLQEVGTIPFQFEIEGCDDLKCLGCMSLA